MFECLEVIDSKDKSVILKVEQRYLDEAGVGANKKCMNILKVANSHLGLKRKPETIEKLKKANVGKKLSDEHKLKLRLAKLGKKQSPEHVLNRTGGQKGKKINRPKGIWQPKIRKFTPQQVIEMRSLKLTGHSYTQISKMFNVSHGGLQKIINRTTYGDVL